MPRSRRLASRSPVLVLALVVAMLVGQAGPTAAQNGENPVLPFPPPDPAPGFDVVALGLWQIGNASLAAAKEEIGATDRYLRDADVEIARAAVYGRSGDLTLLVDHVILLSALINRAFWEHDARGAGDPAEAVYQKSLSAYNEVQTRLQLRHRDLLGLQNAGVDLFQLEYAVLAGDYLAQAQRLLRDYPQFQEAWIKGDRTPDVLNGLAFPPSAASVMVDVADRLVRYAVERAPATPKGLLVGNHSLEAIVVAWGARINNLSRSVDLHLPGIVNDNVNKHRYLAALGSLAMWIRQQPFADAQRKIQLNPSTPGFVPLTPEAAFDTLEKALFQDDIADRVAPLELDGAATNTYLRASLQIYAALAKRMDNVSRMSQGENETIILQASSALGWLGAARMGGSFLLQATGKSPVQTVMYWPGDSVGPAETRAKGDVGVPGWMWVAAALAAVIVVGGAVGMASARRRREPPIG